MPELSFVVARREGHDTPCLVPSTPFDEGALKRMGWKQGDVIESKFTRKRNGINHRRVFGLLKFVFDNQERFDNPEILRRWLTMQTSFVIEGIDRATGEMIRAPRSWAYSEMDETEHLQLREELVPVVLREFYPQETADWLESACEQQAWIDGVMSYRV